MKHRDAISPLSNTRDLSVIIVNRTTRGLLANCLSSVLDSRTQACRLEVIVVDNASTDGSPTMVAEQFPQVQLIQSDINLGYSRASNRGIRCGQGQYVLLLNSDTVVPNGMLARMVEFMDTHPGVGAMGPRLVLPGGRLQPFSYGCDPTLSYLSRRGLNALLRKGYLHDWGIEKTIEVDWVSGASLMLRRRALGETGLLDENFFLYFEDSDLCLRMRRKGWKVYFNPEAKVVHLGGQSLASNERTEGEYYRSLIYFYSKHYGTLKTAILVMLLPLYRWLVGLRR